MVKSKAASVMFASMLFTVGIEASWYSNYDRDGVKSSLWERWSYYVAGLDEYNRYLSDHEKLGGHTVEKHVAKSFGQLRDRCSEVEAKNRYKDYYKTTYSTFNQAKWSTRKLVKSDRRTIDGFKISTNKGILINARNVVNVQRKYKYSNIYTGSSYRGYYLYLNGRGINCNLNVFKKIEYTTDYSSGRPEYKTTYKD